MPLLITLLIQLPTHDNPFNEDKEVVLMNTNEVVFSGHLYSTKSQQLSSIIPYFKFLKNVTQLATTFPCHEEMSKMTDPQSGSFCLLRDRRNAPNNIEQKEKQVHPTFSRFRYSNISNIYL